MQIDYSESRAELRSRSPQGGPKACFDLWIENDEQLRQNERSTITVKVKVTAKDLPSASDRLVDFLVFLHAESSIVEPNYQNIQVKCNTEGSSILFGLTPKIIGLVECELYVYLKQNMHPLDSREFFLFATENAPQISKCPTDA